MSAKSLRKLVSVSLIALMSLSLFTPVVSAATPISYVYQVQRGDSLWLIGWHYEVSVNAIMDYNKLTNTQLMPGQYLTIPASVGYTRSLPTSFKYTAKTGDGLFSIAQKFGVTVPAIQSLNNLTGLSVNPGQVIAIPLPIQTRYTVQNGDSLWVISKKFNVSMDVLTLTNSLNSAYPIWPGEVLFVPANGSTPVPPSVSGPPAPTANPDGTYTNVGSWGTTPADVVFYMVQAGDSLWALAQKYKTTEAAIMATNHLHTDIIQVNQPLYIPQNSTTPATIAAPTGTQNPGFGELMDWQYASWIYDTHNIATIQDLNTDKTFNVRRYGGSNHADSEPLTPIDAAIMKEIFNGQWSWNARPILVKVDGRVLAASMSGMPHSFDSIPDNNFDGHFDIYFLNSRTHYSNVINPQHQISILKAAGY